MRALRAAVVVATGLVLSAGWAQQSVDIVIAGRIVARIRDKGGYASLADRAARADQRIADVISFEDTQHPKVSVRQADGLWHVFVGKRDVIAVFPGDARPQKIDPKTLATQWMRNVQKALPLATPMSKLPPPKPGPMPTGGTPAPKPETPVVPPPGGSTNPGGGPEPGTEMATQTPGASTTPSGEMAPTPGPTTVPPEPKTTPRSAAMLLLLDALNNVRVLSESEYLAARDKIAANLLEYLEPYMKAARAEGEAAGVPQPTRPIEVVKPTRPVVVGPTTGAKPPTGVTPVRPTGPTIPSVPITTTTGPKPGVGAGPVKPGDASMARVPQKQRIGRKFKAAQGPFDQLKASGDPKANDVAALLKAARDCNAAGDFDAAEAAVDQALQTMGVPIPD
jgi:hypothetical protein